MLPLRNYAIWIDESDHTQRAEFIGKSSLDGLKNFAGCCDDDEKMIYNNGVGRRKSANIAD
jgi:hypothetical protein